jgi:HAD superfamily hydrolase (TIGR01484 family)
MLSETVDFRCVMEFVPRIPKVLICSDLDRTVIPNGFQEESAHARPVLRQLAEHPDVYLAYVSGRDQKLILDAIEEFYLPVPDFAIGDVGTTLYRITNGSWQVSEDWSNEMAQDWSGLSWEDLAEFCVDVEELRLQEPEKQGQFKLSFYTDLNVDHRRLIEHTHHLLAEKGVRARIIRSVDEVKSIGLLDITPARAGKLQAIQFLMQQERFPKDRTVFAGDSGNDLDALTSGLQAILVKNAMDDVRKEAIEKLARQQMTNCLYVSKGDFYGMNGYYAAGLLEGLVHYIPETGELIDRAVQK